MTRKLNISIYTFFCGILLCFAQSKTAISKNLSEHSYTELYEIIISDTDSTLLKKAFDAYVDKAKYNKDSLQLAKAFRLNAYNLDFKEGVKSVDSAISIANSIQLLSKKELDEFLAYAYYTKGAILYNNDKNYLAAEELIKCYHQSRKANDYNLSSIVLIYIADIKAAFGQEDEAILLQRKTLDFIKENKSRLDDYNNLYLFWMEQMSRSFLFAHELDSASNYIQKGTELSVKFNDDTFYTLFKNQSAKVNFYLKNFQIAKDTLEKYRNYLADLNSADDLFYLGMIEGELGNSDKKTEYFLTIDSLLKVKNYPLRDNSNEVYQYLLKQAVKDGNTVIMDQYLNRVVYYDSLLLTTQKKLREITLKKFDLPMQEGEKQMLGNIISSKSKWLTWLYIISGFTLLGLGAYYIKYRKTKSRLTYLMANGIPQETHNPIKRERDKLDGDTSMKVLKNLEVWENKKGFLENSLTQQSLAKELNTNSSYLSKVINVHKNKNFANYLKDIRITYAINHLKDNPEIVKSKSMIQIAEMYGFNTLSVFTKSFKSKTGVTPGVFFKRILEDEWRKSS